MSRYRRALVPGGTWFFTVCLKDRQARTLVERVDLLRSAIASARKSHPFEIDAIVILPNHLHTIWTLPPGDARFPLRWAKTKGCFSRSLARTERRSRTDLRRGERGVWQKRYWEHLIRDDRDFEAHVDYCYFNPVKHGLASRVRDWPYSSFHRDVAAGVYPIDWAGEAEDPGFGAGEPI